MKPWQESLEPATENHRPHVIGYDGPMYPEHVPNRNGLLVVLVIALALAFCGHVHGEEVSGVCPEGFHLVQPAGLSPDPLAGQPGHEPAVVAGTPFCEKDETPVTPPAPAPVQAEPGWLHVNAVGGIAHDVQSGWKKPILFAVEAAIGPIHYGPFYVGGMGSYQGSDGIGVAVPLVTYVSRGKFFKGIFRGTAIQVGFRKRDGILSGPTAYYFLVGGSR